MAFPADLTLVTVNMQFDLPVDGGAVGTVSFTARYPLRGPISNSIVPPFGRSVALNATGGASIQLPATNDPQWTPVDWAYEVTARVGSAAIHGTLQLDWAVGSVQLADLLQIDGQATPGTTYATLPQVMDLLAGGGGGGGVTSVNGDTGVVVLDKSDIGLGNVDNTADANKPVSTAMSTALALKAPLASPAFTGTVTGVTATMVGLGNVDNTSDANKPVSTAQGTALALKAPLASPAFTGTVTGVTATMVGLGNVTNTSDANKPVSTAQATALALKADLASPTFTGTVGGITKAMVGLTNVDNTSDANKPVSTATSTALALKAPLASPAFTGTVTGITATMVGLGSVDNTSDVNKPVSTAQAAAIAAMVDPTELTTALASYATNAALTSGLAGKLDAITAYLDGIYGTVTPIDHGLVGWTFDPYAGVQGGVILATAGLAYTTRVRVLRSTITNINLHFTVAGSGLTAGSCFAAVYTDAGVLLGTTVDQAANWASSGYKTCALSSPITGLTPYTWVRVVWWFNGTTGPTLSRAINSNTAITNAGQSANFRSATANTALTTAAPGTLGALTGFLTGWWVGLS